MDIVIRALGLQFSVSFGPEESADVVFPERLGTSDSSFGFAPDAVFAPRYWVEEEE